MAFSIHSKFCVFIHDNSGKISPNLVIVGFLALLVCSCASGCLSGESIDEVNAYVGKEGFDVNPEKDIGDFYSYATGASNGEDALSSGTPQLRTVYECEARNLETGEVEVCVGGEWCDETRRKELGYEYFGATEEEVATKVASDNMSLIKKTWNGYEINVGDFSNEFTDPVNGHKWNVQNFQSDGKLGLGGGIQAYGTIVSSGDNYYALILTDSKDVGIKQHCESGSGHCFSMNDMYVARGDFRLGSPNLYELDGGINLYTILLSGDNSDANNYVVTLSDDTLVSFSR